MRIAEDRDGSETRSKEPHEPKAMPESDRRDGLCEGRVGRYARARLGPGPSDVSAFLANPTEDDDRPT